MSIKFSTYLKEAIIIPQIKQFETLLDDICQNNTIQDFERFVTKLNLIFNEHWIGFIFGTTFNAITEKSGGIILYINSRILRGLINNEDKVKSDVLILLKHEMIHHQHLKKIGPKFIFKDFPLNSDEEIKAYLSSEHEIMAYANQIYSVLIKQFEASTLLMLLKNPRENLQEKCPELKIYLEHFKESDPILKRLYRYIYEYVIEGDSK